MQRSTTLGENGDLKNTLQTDSQRWVSREDQCISRRKSRKSILDHLQVGDSTRERGYLHFHPAAAGRGYVEEFPTRKDGFRLTGEKALGTFSYKLSSQISIAEQVYVLLQVHIHQREAIDQIDRNCYTSAQVGFILETQELQILFISLTNTSILK